MPSCEINLIFNDSEEPVTLRDTGIIMLVPVILRSVQSEFPDFENQDNVKVTSPLSIPFNKKAGVFLFEYIQKYVPPNDDTIHELTVVENYKEAGQKTLDELKEIIELANFFECTDFMECLGFVIGKKLEDKSVEEIAAYMGVECNAPGHFFDEADGWVHPPADAFQNVQ
ncbi:BTB domain-containing protein [Caenorhabditis elegans]|nr:BTB domain-containing protein [Caenorhabditis elegans]CDK13388.1 BTB domain-containing protein [Caenorhabditis elegans]|eukprot:NP_001293711.1 Uncharacterized protein CELE_F15B10.3 [Caenorhabditis elegans]